MTMAEDLYTQLEIHEVNVSKGTEKSNAGLVVKLLQQAYEAHQCLDLPSEDELTRIIQKAYDADRTFWPKQLAKAAHHAQFQHVQSLSEAEQTEFQMGFCFPYQSLLSALDAYTSIAALDVSSQIATPEGAQRYIAETRKQTAEFTQGVLAVADKVPKKELRAMRELVGPGLTSLLGMTDAELLAGANANPLIETEEAQQAFSELKEVVDAVVKYQK